MVIKNFLSGESIVKTITQFKQSIKLNFIILGQTYFIHFISNNNKIPEKKFKISFKNNEINEITFDKKLINIWKTLIKQNKES